MPEPDLLTERDLEALADAARNGTDPAAVVADLLSAVEENRFADLADRGYALTLAAEITADGGDLHGAIELAERAVALHLQGDDDSVAFAEVFLAELLLRSGSEDEGMRLMNQAKPQMAGDPQTGRMVAEALEATGRTELAVQWLAEAIDLAVERGVQLPEDDPGAAQCTAVVYELASTRHRMRGDLGLEHDKYDELADEMEESLAELTGPGPLLFWPEPEFTRLLASWPELAEEWGATWDEHRAMLEQELQAWDESGESGLLVLYGSMAGLTAFAAEHDLDSSDIDVQFDYSEQLEDDSGARRLPWPPPRNGPCWCGSGAKYKKCCLPRGRS
jgi:tetratricopeptide (TPR) repeat protein